MGSNFELEDLENGESLYKDVVHQEALSLIAELTKAIVDLRAQNAILRSQVLDKDKREAAASKIEIESLKDNADSLPI